MLTVLVIIHTVNEDFPFELSEIPRINEHISVREDRDEIIKITQVVHTPWDNTYDAHLKGERII